MYGLAAAQCSTSSLAAGSHQITAVFASTVDGVDGSSSTAVAQVVNTPPVFVETGPASLVVLRNAAATSIAGLLHASDTDAGQAMAWSALVAPGHGSLVVAGAPATSGSANITPGGSISYQPVADYVGADTFTVQLSDGLSTVSRVVNVNVQPEVLATALPVPAMSAVGGLLASILVAFTGAGLLCRRRNPV